MKRSVVLAVTAGLVLMGGIGWQAGGSRNAAGRVNGVEGAALEERRLGVALTMVGQRVKVYFRSSEKLGVEELPGGYLTSLTGNVVGWDGQMLTMALETGDVVWVPAGSIGYVRTVREKGKGAATQPH